MTRPLTAAERDSAIMGLLRYGFPSWDRMAAQHGTPAWNAETPSARQVRGIHEQATTELKRLRALSDAALLAEVRSMVESRSATDDVLAKYEQQEQQRKSTAHAAIERATRHSVGAPGGRARATKLKAQSAEKEGIIGAEVTRILASDARRIAANPAARRLSAKEIAADILKRQTALGISRHYHYTERALYELVRRQIRSQRALVSSR